MDLSHKISEMSEWIDEVNKHRDSEAITWGRLAKISEEYGEVIEAFIGMTGQNPRKGVTHTIDDVRKELLDVAVTALAAFEHMDNHRGDSLECLYGHIEYLHNRMRIVNGI